MTRPRILAFKGGAIGDFILWLPVLQELRGRWPGAHIEVVGYPHVTCLATASGLANHASSLDQSWVAQLFSLRPHFTKRQADWLRFFDLVLNYLYDPDDTVQTNLRAAGIKHPIYGNPIPQSEHATDHLLAPLSQLAIFPAGNASPRLTIPQPSGFSPHPSSLLPPSPSGFSPHPSSLLPPSPSGFSPQPSSLLPPSPSGFSPHPSSLLPPSPSGFSPQPSSLLIHPGSGSPKKNWPIERYIELADRVRATGRRVAFILGEADIPTCAPALESGRSWHIIRDLDLVELTGVLTQAYQYIGNDSGITHLAAAVGTPTVALFGPTDPARWAPRSSNVTVIYRPNDLSAISVEEVFQRVAGSP